MARKYIDVKRTCWFRYELDDEIDLEPIIEDLKNGSTVDDAINGVYPDIWDKDQVQYKVLHDTEEHFSVSDNEGKQTIEVYDEEQSQKSGLLPVLPIFTNKPSIV